MLKEEYEKNNAEFPSIVHPENFIKKADLADLRIGHVFRILLFLMKKSLVKKFKRLFGTMKI